MLFIVGIKGLEREEKIALLSQINSLTGLGMFWSETKKTTRSAQNAIIKSVKNSVEKISKSSAQTIDALSKKMDWNPDSLTEKMNQEKKRLSALTIKVLDQELDEKLKQVANLKGDFEETAIACAIIHEAAKSLGIDPRIYADASSLEASVFEGAIKEMIEMLKKKLEGLNKAEIDQFEELLRQEINQLSKADKKAVLETLGVEELSSKSLHDYLKTASTAAIAQLIVGSFGFGAFLFLTTIIKAFSLLLGFTFPFAVYSGATSLLAFTLSFPFLIAVLFVAGGWMSKKTNNKLNVHIAKLLVVVGRGKLMTKEKINYT